MYPGQQQRGVFQTVNRIVASGDTIVTMGSQTSDGVVRQQFFVSGNGGASWRLAPVHAAGGGPGGQPPLGHPAARLAGGPGGWLAVGPQAIWTSPNGLSWTLAATHGITPMLPGDGMWVLNSTSDGFLAAGVAAAPDHTTQAVIWTSRDGVTWQRKTAAQLGLAGPGETVQSISYVTARGTDTVISGQVTGRHHLRGRMAEHRRRVGLDPGDGPGRPWGGDRDHRPGIGRGRPARRTAGQFGQRHPRCSGLFFT